MIRIALVAAAAAITAAPAPSPPPPRLPIVSPGCQGEACWDRGLWIVTAPLALYARPFAPRPIATLRTGARLTALGGQVWTTRLGSAVLTRPLVNTDRDGKVTARLAKGTVVRILYSEGEGYFAAIAPDGTRVTAFMDEFRELRRFRATDWVRVRLADGRTGWIRHDYDRLDCSSYYDDRDDCRKRGAGLVE
jgi:hypothetical protein